MTTFATSVQHNNGLSSQEKEQKDIQTGKEKVKFSVYRWHDFISRKFLKIIHTHTHTNRTNKFIKVIRHKVKRQISVAFLILTMKKSEKEILKNSLESIGIKYFWINLNNEVKELSPENYKILLKDI